MIKYAITVAPRKTPKDITIRDLDDVFYKMFISKLTRFIVYECEYELSKRGYLHMHATVEMQESVRYSDLIRPYRNAFSIHFKRLRTERDLKRWTHYITKCKNKRYNRDIVMQHYFMHYPRFQKKYL